MGCDECNLKQTVSWHRIPQSLGKLASRRCEAAEEAGSAVISAKGCVRKRAGRNKKRRQRRDQPISVIGSKLLWSMRYGLLFAISLLLDIVGLSSSSFYYQLKALKSPSKYAGLTEKITEIVKDSGFSYGYRRVWIQLKQLGITVSEKVVRRTTAERRRLTMMHLLIRLD